MSVVLYQRVTGRQRLSLLPAPIAGSVEGIRNCGPASIVGIVVSVEPGGF